MPLIGEIARQLASVSESQSSNMACEIQEILIPNPNAVPNLDTDPSRFQAGREEALRALLENLLPERLAALLGGSDEVAAEIAAILNAPFPNGKVLSVDRIDLPNARIQRLELTVCLLAQAIVELMYPSPRELDTRIHSTASRRR